MPSTTDGTSYATVAASAVDADDYFLIVVDGVLCEISRDEVRKLAGMEMGWPMPAGGTMAGVPGVVFNQVGTSTVTANTQYYAPFFVYETVTVDAMICEFTTGAGTLARLGIYNADTHWQPTTLIKDAGTVDSSTNAVRTSTTFSPEIVLTPGRYLTSFACNGGAAMRVVRGRIPLGSVSPTLGASALPLQYRIAAVGVGALASPGVAWDTIGTSTVAFEHFVILRVTAV